MKKIYITGCAKSGTTLMLDMFRAFDRTWVISGETQLQDFCDLKKEDVGDYDFVVAKRSHDTVFSCASLKQSDIDRQLKLIKDNDINSINMVRDGRNVVSSFVKDWGLYNPFEWMRCIDQSDRYWYIIECMCYYESLVSEPNKVQKSLSTRFGLIANKPFEHYPLFIEDKEQRKGNYTYRPLDKSRLKVDEATYLQSPNDVVYFDSLLKKLGYRCVE